MNYKISNTLSPWEFNDLRRAVGWSEVLPETLAQTMIDNSLYFVNVYVEDKIIGTGRVIGDRAYAFYIQDVIVLPEFQGQGFGQLIMEKIMDWLEANTPPDSNVGLMSAYGKEQFYERFGFENRPSEKFGSGMTQFNLEGWKKKRST